MARTKKTAETTGAVATVEAPKRRGRPPKNPPAMAELPIRPVGADKKAAAETAAPRRRGRPPKQASREIAEDKKPGLVSMAPATQVKADRVKSVLHELSMEPSTPRGRGRPAKKVMPVQQEQIIAEELNLKLMNAQSDPKPFKGSAGRPAKKAEPLHAATPEVPKLGRRGRTAQAISLPPAAIQARNRRKLRWAIAVVFVLAACGVGGYFYQNHHVAEAAVSNDTKLIEAIEARVVVPPDETPSISTVVDASQVNQPFLAGAKNGDKVLLYFQAGKAIVYRPSTGQVVNIGSLQEPRPRVFIRKGAGNADTSKIGAEISASGSFSIASQDVSPIGNYAKTIVVDVAGNRPDVASKLAGVLHATVAKLPQGETPPDADLLVIVGSDNPTK